MSQITTQPDGTSPSVPPPPEPPALATVASGTSSRSRIAEVLQTAAISLAMAVAVRVGIAQAYEVDGPSMEPTLVTGEKLLVARCAYGLSLPGMDHQVLSWAEPEVGDVVILASPQVEDEDLVKRVVGVPGDTIELREDVVYRNGAPLLRDGPHACRPERFGNEYAQCETYREGPRGGGLWRIGHSYLGWGQDLGPIAVPPGHVYVLGDHRTRSNDSRAFGPVPVELLRGKVLFVD